MPKIPEISIVLPTFNGAQYIKASIQSVVNQSFKDWELIIVNDGSTDQTQRILDEVSQKYKNIRIYNNPTNKGLPYSLNKGFSEAKGDYLSWTSDDNLYKTNALEVMYSYLRKHPNIDMVSCDEDIINQRGELLYTLSSKDKCIRNNAGLLDACNIGAAFMYTKKIAKKIGVYDISMFGAEDYDYFCRIALKGNIKYLSQNIYQYRLHQNSLTSTKQNVIKKKTMEIKKKYAKLFFKKFHFTKKDEALFWYLSFPYKDRPKKYWKMYLYFQFRSYFSKTLCCFLFFSKKIRHLCRKQFALKKLYSFSKEKI